MPLLPGFARARRVQLARASGRAGPQRAAQALVPFHPGCLSCSSCSFPSSPLSPFLASPTSVSRGPSLSGPARLPVVDLFRGRPTLLRGWHRRSLPRSAHRALAPGRVRSTAGGSDARLGVQMDPDGARRINRSSPSCLNSGAQRTDFFHRAVKRLEPGEQTPLPLVEQAGEQHDRSAQLLRHQVGVGQGAYEPGRGQQKALRAVCCACCGRSAAQYRNWPVSWCRVSRPSRTVCEGHPECRHAAGCPTPRRSVRPRRG